MCLWAVSLQNTRTRNTENTGSMRDQKSVCGEKKKNGDKCMQDHANINVLLGYGGWDQVK